MTQFLVTEDKPDGYKLEEVFAVLRKDMILRMTKILDDDRQVAQQVIDNNIRILNLLTECIHIAEDSSRVLMKNFGPHQDGEPRIGVA